MLKENVNAIRQAQAFKEPYSKFFSGKFSIYIAAASVKSPITPNMLTLAMGASGVLGGLLLSLGTVYGLLLGGILFVFLNILDAADGELARFTNRVSNFGDYLDRVAHYLTNSAAFIGLGIGLFKLTDQYVYLHLMMMLEMAYLFDEVARDLVITCGLKSESSRVDRKNEKAKSKIKTSLGVRKIYMLFFSNLAIFHLTPILASILLISGAKIILNILCLYYAVFAVVNTIKAVVRMIYIFKVYNG